jgi:hypothetical protein
VFFLRFFEYAAHKPGDTQIHFVRYVLYRFSKVGSLELIFLPKMSALELILLVKNRIFLSKVGFLELIFFST